jgi:predicted PurR-regulated permease PerM
MSLIEVLTVILILTALGLSVYLVISLRKITISIQNMQRDFHAFTIKAEHVLENLNRTTERVDRITAEAEKQWHDIEDRISSLRHKIGHITGSGSILDTVETVKNFSTNIKSLFRGISAFLASWQGN